MECQHKEEANQKTKYTHLIFQRKQLPHNLVKSLSLIFQNHVNKHYIVADPPISMNVSKTKKIGFYTVELATLTSSKLSHF